MDLNPLIDWVRSLDITWEALGTIADSVAGLGSVGAVVVAVMVYRRQVADARRAQASRVVLSTSAGAVFEDAAEDSNPDMPAKVIVPLVKLTLMNNSELPIFRIDYFTYAVPLHDDAEALARRSLGPGDTSVIELLRDQGRLIDWRAAVHFRDAAGNAWIRYDDGTLEASRGSRTPKYFKRLAGKRLKPKSPIDVLLGD